MTIHPDWERKRERGTRQAGRRLRNWHALGRSRAPSGRQTARRQAGREGALQLAAGAAGEGGTRLRTKQIATQAVLHTADYSFPIPGRICLHMHAFIHLHMCDACVPHPPTCLQSPNFTPPAEEGKKEHRFYFPLASGREENQSQEGGMEHRILL